MPRLLGPIVGLGLALIGLSCSSAPAPHTHGVDERWLREQLRRIDKDLANTNRRHLALGSHFPPPVGLIYALYPVRHAEGKIIARGRDVIDPLVRIACDPAEDGGVGPNARWLLM